MQNAHFEYWGKFKDGQLHLLAYHCLDVAAVGRLLLESDLSLPGVIDQNPGLFGLTQQS